MRALVTGGAGFIGSHLVARLLAKGAEVRVLDDLSTGDPAALDPAADLVVGDVTDAAAVAAAMCGRDVVFHLAAHRAVTRSIDDPEGTDRANSQGTVTVLQAAVEKGLRRIVYASSSSVYGDPASTPVREDAPTVPMSPYAVSKLAGEHYCRVFRDLYGLETVSLRYFNVYGPGQASDGRYATVVPLFVEALLAGRRPVVYGDGSVARDFTYVDDAMAATIAAATVASPGLVYNVGGGRPRSILELLALVGDELGVDPDPVFEAPRPGDVARTHADPSAARRDLGLTAPVDLEAGLARTIEWVRAGRERVRTGAGRD